MDLLSITASIIAVLQVTKEVVSYVKETKDARKDLEKFYEEARSLVILLHELKDLVADPNSHNSWLRITSGLAARDGPLAQYKKSLEILVSKTTGHGLRKIGQVLAWKFTKGEVMAVLSQIERVKSLVQIALEMDHIKLSHAIESNFQTIITGVADLQLDTSTIKDSTSKIKSDTTFLVDETAVRLKKDLLQWICPVDYHVQHRDFIDRHQPGTGQWFLQDMKFQEWNWSKDGTLSCPGIPGAGKTIMAALVIDHLLRNQHVADEPVTFVYCNYKRQSEQSAKHILSSILRQIIDIQPGVPKLVQDFYTSHTAKRTTPSSSELTQVLEAVSKDLLGMTVIVDALDECEARVREEFLSAVENLREHCKVRLLATSRPLPPVQSHPTFLDKPALEVRASNEDLEKYIRSRAGELHSRVMSKPDFLLDLVASTISATGGMFLLAQLLMDSFRDKLRVRDVKSALRDLPQGSDAYDVAYHAAMERISIQGKGSSDMAKKILAWILCAHRPLSTLELLHALAIEPGDKEIDEDNILETEQLLTICAGLVTIDEQSDSVRFVHYTTQEYLQRNQQTWLPHAKIEVARSCTAYLSIDGLLMGPCSSQVDHERRLKEFPLLEYAAVYWGPHLNLLMETSCASAMDEITAEVLRLLLDTTRLSAISQVLFMSIKRQYLQLVVREEGKGFSGGHWIARFGLLPLLKQWMHERDELDHRDSSGRIPLSWAAESGYASVVKQLLDTGKVVVDSKDKFGQTPLSWAARSGRNAIVKQLLDTGKVVVDSKDEYGQTPLLWAARNGQVAIVKQLLSTGKYGPHPWSIWAAEDGERITPRLHVAASIPDVNHLERVLCECLPEALDAIDSPPHYRTPLSWAIIRNLPENIAVLLDAGVDTKIRVRIRADDVFWPPLFLAAALGHSEAIEVLIRRGGLDPNQKLSETNGNTPLHVAALNGRSDAVRTLLELGADPWSKDSKDQWTVFDCAIAKKDENLLEILSTYAPNADGRHCPERASTAHRLLGVDLRSGRPG